MQFFYHATPPNPCVGCDDVISSLMTSAYAYRLLVNLVSLIMEINHTRSSCCYAPFLLAPAEGIGGPFRPFGPSRGPKGPPLPFTKRYRVFAIAKDLN